MILKIAKNELRNLFYSPVAWFLIIVFLIQCAVFFTDYISSRAYSQDGMTRLSAENFHGLRPNLTLDLFFGREGFLMGVIQNLYLFLPLLTMGLISREINSGSISLLYSSPVKLWHIVVGKYLAIMAFCFVLLSIVGMFMMVAVFDVYKADYGMFIGTALGLYFVICAYTAIGLFMSSLTTYQIISAIGTFVIIFILTRIGGLWQNIDFIRDLTYFLSLQDRMSNMIRGLISTKDIIYYIAVVTLFVGLTLLRMYHMRGMTSLWNKISQYGLLLGCVLLVGYVSSRPRFICYWDTTATQMHTIHPNTQKILADLEGPLTVTLYTNLLDAGMGWTNGLPSARNRYLSDVWEKYLRFKPDIVFKYEYYYDYNPKIDHYSSRERNGELFKKFPKKSLEQIAIETARMHDIDFELFKKPEDMRKSIDLDQEGFRMVMHLSYKGRSTFLRTYNDTNFWPFELHFNSAFQRLIGEVPPNVGFVTGNLERSIYSRGERHYFGHTRGKQLRGSLVNIGFDADSLNLDNQEIPSGISALVLADPKIEFSAVKRAKLDRYVANGGNLMVLGEPHKLNILNPFLETLGVKLMPGQLVQPSKNETPEKVNPYLTLAALELSKDPGFDALKLRFRYTGKMPPLMINMHGVTGLGVTSNPSAFVISPVALSPIDLSWLTPREVVVDSLPPKFNAAQGDINGSFPTIFRLTRQMGAKEQRILVSSDADYISTLRLSRPNSSFISGAYSWLTGGRYPVYTPGIPSEDIKLNISRSTANLQRIVLVWVLPALVLLAGAILLLRRKRK